MKFLPLVTQVDYNYAWFSNSLDDAQERKDFLMKELKFRAWHRKDQKIISPAQLSEQRYSIDPNGKGFLKIDSAGKLQYFSTMLPLIYSGLNDRNGNEIYEADILKFENRVYQILWYDAGLWMIREDGKPIDLAKSSDESEVLGDLYSNPEKINA